MPTNRPGPPVTLGFSRVLKPGRLLWLRAIGWLIFSIFVVAFAFGTSSDAITKLLADGGDPSAFVARLAGPLVALVAYALLVRFGEARRPLEIGLKAALPELVIGLMLGTAMFATVMLILVGMGLYDFRPIGWLPAWKAAGASIEAGIVEELMVRGLILRLMWRAFGPAVAFVVSAAAFGVGHLGNDNVTAFAIVCIALEAGIMLGAFYALTGRLWLSISVHIGWNFAQGYLFGAAVSGQPLGSSAAISTARLEFPQWLTGGSFGPEASLPALFVCSAVGTATLYLAWRAGRFDNVDLRPG